MKLYHGTILRNYVMELCHGAILLNYITESYHGKKTVKRNAGIPGTPPGPPGNSGDLPGTLLGPLVALQKNHISTNLHWQKLPIAASKPFRCNASTQRALRRPWGVPRESPHFMDYDSYCGFGPGTVALPRCHDPLGSPGPGPGAPVGPPELLRAGPLWAPLGP